MFLYCIQLGLLIYYLSLSPVSFLSLCGSGRGKEPVGEPGGAGEAAGFNYEHGGHPADGEGEAANWRPGVKEGAGWPADVVGRPRPEDHQPEEETERAGRDGRKAISIF